MFRRILIAAIVPAIVAAMLVTTGTATAAPGRVYCLNGVSTTLSASASVQGGSLSLPAGIADLIISFSDGSFYPGIWTATGTTAIVLPAAGNPATLLNPGYSTNFVGIGACAITSEPADVGVCIALKRSDGTTGLFQEIPVNVWNDSTSSYFAAPAANWVEGVGLTCDNPLARCGLQRRVGRTARPEQRSTSAPRFWLQQHLPVLHEVERPRTASRPQKSNKEGRLSPALLSC